MSTNSCRKRVAGQYHDAMAENAFMANYTPTPALTAQDRTEVQEFFETHFPDIAPDAIPAIEHDNLYDPIILTVRENGPGGRILAAALSCRTNEVVALLRFPLMAELGASAKKVAPLHSNLDLIATATEARGAGLGAMLLTEMEARLAEKGVRVWFGCVTEDLDTVKLRPYYEQRGFTVLADGEPLPPLLGFPAWNLGKGGVSFYFYKRIK
jgi:ribosomal protein S18 acetylase RimI-like enzyme